MVANFYLRLFARRRRNFGASVKELFFSTFSVRNFSIKATPSLRALIANFFASASLFPSREK